MQSTGSASIRLVIFDCDGVLVDSERISNEVLADILGMHGIALSWMDAQTTFVGQSTGQIRTTVTELFGITLPDDWSAHYYERMIPALASRVEAIDGAIDAVRAVRAAGLKFCVASQGPMAKIEATLTSVGLWGEFEEAVYSAYMVQRPKPAPDLFLFAAQNMNVAPAECVVIEDSPMGVAAAVGAGMQVLAFCPNGGADMMRARGGMPFRSMSELPTLLRLG